MPSPPPSPAPAAASPAWGLPLPAYPPARQAAAGAAAGLVVFLLLELGGQVPDLQGGASGDYWAWRGAVMTLGIAFGAVVTAALSLAEELDSGSPGRMLARSGLGAVAGAVLSTGYSIIGGAFFAVAADALPPEIARALGWSLFGLGVGLSAGILARSGRRATLGVLGGLAGGFLGGALFSALSGLLSGPLGRMVGYMVLAACVGAATALVEQWTRQAWLVFLSGSREGRQVILHRDEVLLGRDELADVPLFGDPRVERRHALIEFAPAPVIRDLASSGLLHVDGQPVQEAALYDGAVIQLGRHRFRFHHCQVKRGSAVHAAADRLVHSPWTALPAAAPGGAARDPVPASPASPLSSGPVPPVPSGMERTLIGPEAGVLAAPAPAGQVRLGLRLSTSPPDALLPLGETVVTLGRELDNTLPLADPRVSRYHARVCSMGDAWVVVDLGSTNGIRLNGLRVSRAGLMPGDQISLGDTVLLVEQVSA